MESGDSGGDGRTGQPRKARLALWAVLVWLVAWQVASWALASELLLPGPLDVLERFALLAASAQFWSRVLFSAARILGGAALGCLAGAVGSAGAVRWHRIDELLAPIMTLARSVPVASFTVLALIWLSASRLAVLVVALVVMPIVYENVRSGLLARDGAREEMVRVFKVPAWRAFRLVTLPQLLPYLQAAARLGMGMAWKAGVAAEVIGIPFGSLGEAIFTSKVHFDTVELFAWTLGVVLLSVLCERIVTWALGKVGQRLSDVVRVRSASSAPRGAADMTRLSPAGRVSAVCLEHVSKRYGDGDAAAGPSDVSLLAHAGSPLCLDAPSGSGKTTLLRIIAGLEAPDSGMLRFEPTGELPRIGMVFQENRLCPQASVLENARIACARGSVTYRIAPHLLAALGLGDCLDQTAASCSGGQQRRIALARALLSEHDVLLLDEPFSGLDVSTRQTAAALVRSLEARKVVIVASHDPEDASLLRAVTLERT